MSQAALLHPTESDPIVFDLWEWRNRRIKLVAQLFILASVELGRNSSALSRLAGRIESETFDASDHEALLEILTSHGIAEHDLACMRRLERSLDKLIKKYGIMPPRVKRFLVRPDWPLIQQGDERFVGTIDGIYVEAELLPDESLIPPYAVSFPTEHPPFRVLHIHTSRMGPNLGYARPVWDWMLVRRLTNLLLEGHLTWPSDGTLPLVLKFV